MRRVLSLALPVLFALASSCAFLVDFDELGAGGPAGGGGGAAAEGGVGPAAGRAGAAQGGAAGAAGAAGIDLDQVAPALAEALCANLTACYGPLIDVFVHDEDCAAYFGASLGERVITSITASVAEGTLTYDGVGASECIRAIAEGTQQTPPTCFNPRAIVERCKLAFGNLAGEGLPCRHTFECEPGHSCDLATCPGTCRPLGALGAPCTVDEECDPGQDLYCRKLPTGAAGAAGAPALDAGVCTAYAELDAPCVENQDECAPGTLCVQRSCRRLSLLFTLEEPLECLSNGLLCEPGLSCEFQGIPGLSASACVSEKQPLDACKLALPGECPKDTYCSADPFNNNGRCLASPVENQPCAVGTEQNTAISASCHSGLVCLEGICKPMRHLEEPCEADAQCFSGACQPPAAGGVAVCVPPGCP